MSTGLVLWDSARTAIEQARSIDEVKDIRDRAEALRLYAKQAGETLEVQNNVAEIKIRAERRAGELLKDIDRHRATDGRPEKVSRPVTLIEPRPTLPDLGITRMQSSRWQRMAEIPEPEFEEHIARTKAANEELTSASVQRLARLLVRAEPPEPSTLSNGGAKRASIEVYDGDSLSILTTLPTASFDLLLTDPPYNTKRMDWDEWETDQAFVDWTYKWLTLCLPLMKPEYNAFVFCSPNNAAEIEIEVLRPLGLKPKSRIIWNHRNLSMGRDVSDRFINTYDVIFHFGTRELNWPKEWDEQRFDVQIHAAPQTNFEDTKYHQTQKPYGLIKLLCAVGSFQGDNVLDPFSGSGTTGAACLELERDCTMIDNTFAALSAKRVGVEVKNV